MHNIKELANVNRMKAPYFIPLQGHNFLLIRQWILDQFDAAKFLFIFAFETT